MNKNGLFILSIGLFIIMLSGSGGGDGESTNYLIMVTGLFFAGIGAYIAFGKKKIKNSEKK